jgi:hypothetical protein
MGRRPLPEDFKDFISFLNTNNVEYLLVGGWALGLYGNPRATKDIDILISVDEENLKKLKKAFYEFGTPTIDMGLFKEPGNFFRMGRPPVQIDVITQATGIDIKDCYSRKNNITLDGIDIAVISKADLIKNKKASGRLQDLADAENLEDTEQKET